MATYETKSNIQDSSNFSNGNYHRLVSSVLSAVLNCGPSLLLCDFVAIT